MSARLSYRECRMLHLLHRASSIRVEGSVTQALTARAAQVWAYCGLGTCPFGHLNHAILLGLPLCPWTPAAVAA
jgi:hypothetical protein